MDVPLKVWILRIRVLMLDPTPPPPPAGAFGVFPLSSVTAHVQ